MYLIIANTFWIQKAFMLKQTKATINNYGIYYIKGIGVQQNIEKAKAWREDLKNAYITCVLFLKILSYLKQLN